MLRRIFCALMVVFIMTCVVRTQWLPSGLNFGLISTESSSNLRFRWQPLLADLSQRLGIPVRPFFAVDYAGIIEAMRLNKVQLAWYGNKSAMRAVDVAQGEVFASVINRSGNAGYRSVLLVRKSSPYQSVADIIEHAGSLIFGAGDPDSTSGTLMPDYYLWAAHGVDPRVIFKAVRTANHETNLLSVIGGQVDVAVNNTEALARYARSVNMDANDLVNVIWTSPLIPSDLLVWRTDLSAQLKQEIRVFFLNYGRDVSATDERRVLLALDYLGFRESDNQYLLPIRQLALVCEKARVQADAKLSAAERAERAAQLDEQLAALQKQSDAATAP